MKLPSAESIRTALDAHERPYMPALPGRTNHLGAGVLVPLRWQDDDIEVILTLRSQHLQNHPGEISFPGGRPEDGDEDLQATALREADEEIGLREAEVLGALSTIPLYTSDYRLHPYVARVAASAELVPNPDEVESLVTVHMRHLLEGGVEHGIGWEHEGQTHISPVFETPERLVFGGTAYALWELLGVVAPLFGIERPTLKTGKYTWPDVLDL